MKGEFTFLNKNCSSVIDYVCVSLQIIDIITSFKLDQQIFSDHMPIITSVICNNFKLADKYLKLCP